MTRENIIETAFEVWGRDLYKTTSLSQISGELGVSKAALYRHFKNKDALLEAMNTTFFDECAGFIKTSFDGALFTKDRLEAVLIMMKKVSEYYILNPGAFIFALVKVTGAYDKERMINEFRSRGIDFKLFARREGKDYPSKIQLIMLTLTFSLAQFHRLKENKYPTNAQVKKAILEIENRVMKGLDLDERKVAAIDFQKLEQQAAGHTHEYTENNALLKAVAGVVAEAGPWNASMEMVAKRSGLSKSGLYAHFKNKQDMLNRLFTSEFSRIVDFAKEQIATSNIAEEQLYLGIISIIGYLRSRPEILLAADWIKSNQFKLGNEMPVRLYDIIGNIKIKTIMKQDIHYLVWIAQWILFMIISSLAWYPRSGSLVNQKDNWANNAAEVPNKCFRILFRFIALGLGGSKI